MLIPLRQLIRTHRIRIDGIIHCGAHLGEEARAYAAAGAGRKVLWIEGNPDLIPRLTAHVRRYRHNVACVLLASQDGVATLNIANNSESSSVLQLGTHREQHPEIHYVDTVTLPTTTLDTVTAAYGARGYNFLNLDLQGYELETLRGGTETLEAGVHYIYTEFADDELYIGGPTLTDLDRWLAKRDFIRVAQQRPRGLRWGDALYIHQSKAAA